jgi:hypothetical protein
MLLHGHNVNEFSEKILNREMLFKGILVTFPQVNPSKEERS